MNPKFEVISAWTYKRYFLGFNVIETSPEVKREDVIRHINLTDGDGNCVSNCSINKIYEKTPPQKNPVLLERRKHFKAYL